MNPTTDIANLRRKDFITNKHGFLNLFRVITNHIFLVLGFVLLDIYASTSFSVVGAICMCWIHQRFVSEMLHEASHFNLIPQREWNDTLANWLLSYWHGYTVQSYRKTHMHHHAQNTFFFENDPDTAHLAVKSRQDLHGQILRDLTGWTAIKNYWDVFIIGRGNRKSDTLPSRLSNLLIKFLPIALLHFAFLSASILSGLFVYYLIYMVTLITVYSFMNRIRLYGQHVTITDTGDVSAQNTHSARTILGGLFDRLFYSSDLMLYHHEHHERPNLPYRALIQACPHNTNAPNEYMKGGRWSLLLKFYKTLPRRTPRKK